MISYGIHTRIIWFFYNLSYLNSVVIPSYWDITEKLTEIAFGCIIYS